MHVLLESLNSQAQLIKQSYLFCKTVKLCTYVHLVWASEGRGRHGGAIHWTWIDAYGTHEPIHVQEAEKESHGAATAWPKPSISRFLWYSGPDGACKWVIWGWESRSGSCALHSRPHLMPRVLNLDMSVSTGLGFKKLPNDSPPSYSFDAPVNRPGRFLNHYRNFFITCASGVYALSSRAAPSTRSLLRRI